MLLNFMFVKYSNFSHTIITLSVIVESVRTVIFSQKITSAKIETLGSAAGTPLQKLLIYFPRQRWYCKEDKKAYYITQHQL